MAEVFREDFDGLADGTPIDHTNTAFDSSGGDGTREADTAFSVTGSVSCAMICATTSENVRLDDAFTATGSRWFRWYFRPPSLLNLANQPLIAVVESAGANQAEVRIENNGTLSIRENLTEVATTTVAVTAGDWNRIEWGVVDGGNQTLRLFTAANVQGTTPDDEISDPYGAGTFDSFTIGPFQAADAWTYHVDSVVADDATFPGPENQAPTADAGPDQTVTEGTVVTLDGTGSTDPEDASVDLDYAWTVSDDGGTGLTNTDIKGRLTDTASFTAPDVSATASIILQLQVTDTGGLSDTDTVTITVEEPPSGLFPIDSRVELRLGGAWTDVTRFVYDRDPITITRGRSDEAGQTDPSMCSMTLNNRDGRFSPRNPRGLYFGQIGRNTPIRIYRRLGERALDLTEDDPATLASTPDSAALSITDELDVRIDATSRYWGRRNLIGKTDGPPQRSWDLIMDDGALVYGWSPDGTNGFFVTTDRLPLQPGRRAVRVTHVVDDGMGDGIVTFYTAPTIDGPWTQLEQHVFGAEPLFDSTAPVKIGNLFGVDAFPGVVHAAEIRHGIDGTVAADPDFSVPAEGTSSFSDPAGNVWTVSEPAVITNRRFRFHGEISEWPVRWDTSGNDVFVPVEAAGILRRLGAGASALDSAFKRFRLGAGEPAPVAYWPMEDERDAAELASALDSGRPMTFTRPSGGERTGVEARLGADGTFQCSRLLPIMGDGQFKGRIPRYADTGATEVSFLLNAAPINEGELNALPDHTVIVSVDATGTAARWELRYRVGGQLQLFRFDAANNAEANGSLLDVRLGGYPLLCVLEWVADGADVVYTIWVAHVDSGQLQSVTNRAVGETFGVATRVVFNLNRDLEETVIGHAAVVDLNAALADDIDALRAHTGETPFDRFDRLCREEDVPQRITGLPGAPWMGAQLPRRFVDLVQKMAESDSGMLFEPRDHFSLGLRTHGSIYNQTPLVSLDYANSEVSSPLEPTDDDQQIANDVTVSQEGGASARFVAETGPLNVRKPEDDPRHGVGRYDASVTVSAAHGEFLPHMAGWQVRLGTVDESRYPQITVELAAEEIRNNPNLVEALLFLDAGDRIEIVNPPDWLPPEQISQIVQGYSETIDLFTHRITFNCSPESPWQVAELDGTGATASRYGTSGSELIGAVFDSDTSLTVADPDAGPGQVTEGFEDSDLDIDLSGTWARSTASANTGSWSLKAATITHNETTDAIVQVPDGATSLTFAYRVSSEATFDFFRFLIDGVQQFEDSGDSGWVESGPWDVSAAAEVTFRYAKDVSVSSLEDTAYVDDVAFTVEGIGGEVWTTDAAEFPLDIKVGGERMRVSGISAPSGGEQVFTVTRSVNGIVKSHDAGTAVELFEPSYRAL